jgi:hypothetical protein
MLGLSFFEVERGQRSLSPALPSLQAVKQPRHFTQSAGLIAAHPIADALADECAAFAWRLRAEAFLRFGYDPEGAFASNQDDYGFSGCVCEKIWHCSDAAVLI